MNEQLSKFSTILSAILLTPTFTSKKKVCIILQTGVALVDLHNTSDWVNSWEIYSLKHPSSNFKTSSTTMSTSLRMKKINSQKPI